MQLAPEHPLVTDLRRQNPDVARQSGRTDCRAAQGAKEAGDIGAIEKHGVFTGRYAINPFNGEKVPIWVANYILMDYGTGAIMTVPAHDERDYEFAKKYGWKSGWSFCRSPNDPEETVAEPAASVRRT